MKPSIAVALSLTLVGSALAQERPAATPPDPAREARLAWFREAKYGLFIHWGLYAIPAGEWKGEARPRDRRVDHEPRRRSRSPEYETLAAQFNPVKFDADAWVRLAKDAGMKYIVITSKHHDGFALFDSKVSRYDVGRRDALQARHAEGAGRGLREGRHAARLLLLAGAGLARPERGRQHVGLRPGREEGLRPLPAREGGAAGARAADRLRARRPRLVRHAADDDPRAGAALHRPRAVAPAEHADRRPARRGRRLRVDRRQRDPVARSGTRPGRPRPRSTTRGATGRTTTTGSRPATSRSSWSTS